MKLYDSRRAPNPRRVRWVMAEKGITDIEVVEVDLLRGEHRSPDYRARVGMAVVPALELDDGAVITESLAIARYLDALYPEPNLFGRDPREAAEIEMWTRRAEMTVATPLMLAVRYGFEPFAVMEGFDPTASEKHRASVVGPLKRLNRQLDGRDFITAGRITIADIVLVTGMDFARLLKWRPPEDLANLNRWYEAVRARPAASASVV